MYDDAELSLTSLLCNQPYSVTEMKLPDNKIPSCDTVLRDQYYRTLQDLYEKCHHQILTWIVML
jgi:23S rRNA A1618 N6-methylase RlmF